MWVYRLGAEKAKRMLLTGDLITGREAQEMGLINQAVPAAELDDGAPLMYCDACDCQVKLTYDIS